MGPAPPTTVQATLVSSSRERPSTVRLVDSADDVEANSTTESRPAVAPIIRRVVRAVNMSRPFVIGRDRGGRARSRRATV
jgi:hypothetical protein